MTTKISSATLFLTIVMGCSTVEDGVLTSSSNTYDANHINFTTQTTKAMSNDVGSIEGDTDGFVVYGVEVDSSDWSDYLDGNSYIYDLDTKKWGWKSEETPSWPSPFVQMNFYAHYPTTASGFSASDTAPSRLIGEIEVESSILDQTDYLASASGDILTKPLTGILSLNFTHIMSKISFSVIQEEGILTLIRQLGIENIINKGSYDYIASQWNTLSNTNIGSFSDYIGSSGPFAKYGVADQVDLICIDDHYLILIPQTSGDEDNQTPLWDGSSKIDESGDLIPEGAYISIRYRLSDNKDTEDMVGYAFRRSCSNETEYDTGDYFYNVYKLDGGSYTSPLYVKAGFKLTAEQLDWEAGSEYNYTLQLHKSGGIYLSEYYYDVDGRNTFIRVDGSPSVGDPVFPADISAGVTVSGWNHSSVDLYPM